MFTKLIFTILILFTLSDASIHKQNDVTNTLEIYFDLPTLDLLSNNTFLKYQSIQYMSKKKNKKKYHESIKYLSKDEHLYTFKVKHYNTVKFIEEKHPLLSLIKRKDRTLFENILYKDGIIYPMKLKYVFQAEYDTNQTQTYQEYFQKRFNHNPLAKLTFKYPYLINLVYAILFASIGLFIIIIQLQKRH